MQYLVIFVRLEGFLTAKMPSVMRQIGMRISFFVGFILHTSLSSIAVSSTCTSRNENVSLDEGADIRNPLFISSAHVEDKRLLSTDGSGTVLRST